MDLGVLIMVQCQACFGEYAPITADGTRYFHVCPPAIVVTVRQGDGSTVRAPLADFAGVSLVRSDAERDDAIAAGVKAEAVAVVTRREDLDRVDRRDERIAAHGGLKGEIAIIVREGAGALDLASGRPVVDRIVDDL